MAIKKNTPWGKPQYTKVAAPGITFYSTAGHGGYFVGKALLKTMPIALQNPDGWYEEDCEWCKVCLAFPHAFPERALPIAQASYARWFSGEGGSYNHSA